METDSGDWTDRSLRRRARRSTGARSTPSPPPTPASPSPAASRSPSRRCASRPRSTRSKRGALPALGRLPRHGHPRRPAPCAPGEPSMSQRVPNAAIVPPDPREAAEADLGGGAGDDAELTRRPPQAVDLARTARPLSAQDHAAGARVGDQRLVGLDEQPPLGCRGAPPGVHDPPLGEHAPGRRALIARM